MTFEEWFDKRCQETGIDGLVLNYWCEKAWQAATERAAGIVEKESLFTGHYSELAQKIREDE